MAKRLLFFLAALMAGAAASAAEDYMPLHPGGAYAETGGGTSLRRVSSTGSGPARYDAAAVPELHKNVVTLKLPSLGARGESRLRIVDAAENALDGSLNFDAARPATLIGQAEIPGLVAPEMLAMDMYNMADAEAGLPRRAVSPLPLPEALEKPAPVGSIESLLESPRPSAFSDPADDLIGPRHANLRRLESLDREQQRDLALSQLDSLTGPVRETPSPARVSLPAPLFPSDPAYQQQARSPLAPPPSFMPPTRLSVAPPPVFQNAGQPSHARTETIAAPPLFYEPEPETYSMAAPGGDAPFADQPGFMAQPEYADRPAVVPNQIGSKRASATRKFASADSGNLTPMRELKNVLDPIYRNSGR